MADREYVKGERINLHQRAEVREWSRYLGVTPEAVRSAAAAVGDRAERVREHLQGMRTPASERQVRTGRAERDCDTSC